MSEYIVSTTNMPEHVRETLNAWCDVSGEIVRCGDCAYVLHREYNSGFEYHTCSYFDSEHAEVELNGFCAWGVERKEGGDD